ncbi:hypothetical protein SASPL_114934 [Salvia splendens]|uniref:Protein FAR1-RELATED SEQUENCE n=1 Tax=Salvia splendens TaxID=180675 RepID=A0A8X8Y7E5_SALSN|nr:hypothetical protein SASPL_114934 [Salvia splendens]
MTHFEMEDNTEIYTITDSLQNKVVVRHKVGTESYHCDFHCDPIEEASSSEVSQVDRKRGVAAKLHSLYFHLFQRAQSNDDEIVALFDGMEELSQKLFGDTVPSVSSMDKAQRIENLYGASRPSVVNVHPPNVVSTKGSGSSSGKRIASATEKAIILQNKPKRRCAKCREMGHHDARNCGREKGKAKM